MSPEHFIKVSIFIWGMANVCVIGLGRIGLPTALWLAGNGHIVYGVDIDKGKVDELRKGVSPIDELDLSFADGDFEKLNINCGPCGAGLIKYGDIAFCPTCRRQFVDGEEEELPEDIYKFLFSTPKNLSSRVKSVLDKSFFPTTDFSVVSNCQFVILIVGTYINDKFENEISPIVNASTALAPFVKKGCTIILKSTVPIGTTRNIVGREVGKYGLRVGADFFLAFFPERAGSGNVFYELETFPRIVGGINDESAMNVIKLFSPLIRSTIMKVDSPEVAEAAKLFENTYRNINIGLVNELALLMEKLGLDVTRVIKAANTRPNTHLLSPGPGVGGHCISKDPWYLVNAGKEVCFNTKIIRSCLELNEKMPKLISRRVGKGKRIGLLGLSFKKNFGELFYSPAVRILNLLKNSNEVTVLDPFVKEADLKKLGVGFTYDFKKFFRDKDVILILKDHDDFRKTNLLDMISKDTLIIDAVNLFDKKMVIQHGFKYLGLGK